MAQPLQREVEACGDAESLLRLGQSLYKQDHLEEAVAAFRKLLQLRPEHTSARAFLCHLRRMVCDWSNAPAEEARVLEQAAREGAFIPPLQALNMGISPAGELRNARLWVETLNVEPSARLLQPGAPPAPRPGGDRRIRLGYLSGDFHNHATAHLTAELFERHDRSRFSVAAYSYGPDDGSAMRQRLLRAFDRFVDLRGVSDEGAARRIFDDGVDILVDLKGHSLDARTRILAWRPAPVQVNCVVYPGTMGADFIDYIIGDPYVSPFDSQEFFDERIVQLPHCYQPNDTRRKIAEFTPFRADCGLPESGFVFCCFNGSYKLTPVQFDVWMRLLAAVPGSVLWLLETNALAAANLRREALARGVNPARLAFASRLRSPEHLARHRLADLFLDTLPVNAHTTASDALWAGLPVLTCVGGSFVSRVAGSLLRAAGLPELVTHTEAEYEATALRLVSDPVLLGGLRRRLADARLASPLFDIKRYASNLEAAFSRMWELYEAGRPPEALAVRESEAPLAAGPASGARTLYGACPLCGGLNIPAVKIADCSGHPKRGSGLPASITWLECETCGHQFTDGYFAGAAAESLSAKALPEEAVGFEAEARRPAAGRMVERAVRHLGDAESLSGDWLDVNCGTGALLFAAGEWGFAPVAAGLRADNVRLLKLLGYEAHQTDFEELDQPGRFTVVSMANSLQRAPFPRKALEVAHRLLRPGGVLLLVAPNTECIVWRALNASDVNPYWAELENYHNFSRRRLCALLRECGFRPMEYGVSETIRAGMEIVAVKRLD